MNHFTLAGRYLYDIYVLRLSSLPFPYQISLLIIAFFLICIVEIIVLILIGRVKGNYTRKRDLKYKARIISMLANVIVFSDTMDIREVVTHFLPRFFRIPLYRSSVRKLLVAELVNSHSDFNGRAADLLAELYRRLKLDRRARKNLTSRSWSKQIEAIRELTEMSMRKECEKILLHTGSDIPQLRLEAQTAYIRLCSEEPFLFLDNLEKPILGWHQIILFDVAIRKESIEIPSFVKWLNSKNATVVLFCLKLIEHYKQYKAIPTIIYLLNHYDLEIRASAINVLGKLRAEEAGPHLINAYPNQILTLKPTILNALGLIGSRSSLTFLNGQILEDVSAIRFAAQKATASILGNSDLRTSEDMDYSQSTIGFMSQVISGGNSR